MSRYIEINNCSLDCPHGQIKWYQENKKWYEAVSCYHNDLHDRIVGAKEIWRFETTSITGQREAFASVPIPEWCPLPKLDRRQA